MIIIKTYLNLSNINNFKIIKKIKKLILNRNIFFHKIFFKTIKYIFFINFISIIVACNSLHISKNNELLKLTNLKLYEEFKTANLYNRWSKCIDILKLLQSRNLSENIMQKIQINLAYCQWQNDENENAIDTINYFMHLYPTYNKMEYLHYLKGKIYYGKIDYFSKFLSLKYRKPSDILSLKKSYNEFQIVIKKYQNNKFKKKSIKYIKCISDMLASYEINIANYYYTHYAYIAAINRAKSIIINYSYKEDIIKKAIDIINSSYKKLNEKN